MEESSKSDSRLVFHSKSNSYGGDKGQTRRYCDQVANLIKGFLPGCQVRYKYVIYTSKFDVCTDKYL